MERLKKVVARLRDKDGCPWDRKQTHESLKPEVIEEAAEVVCGINIYEKTGASENLKEELGDLLLQVVMQAQIAEEEGLFSLEDVAAGAADKMIRRHPHVFGGGKTPEGGRGVCRLGGDQEEGEDRKRVGGELPPRCLPRVGAAPSAGRGAKGVPPAAMRISPWHLQGAPLQAPLRWRR